MRIISQNRTEDIPYELSRLYISAVHIGTIYAEVAGMSDATLLGDYYASVDAITALAGVRAAYRNEENVFMMPTAEEIARKRLGHD